MRAQTPVRVVTVLTLIALVAVLFPLAGQAVTKAQVEEACADSRAQLEEYRAAQAAFEVAAHEYEDAVIEVDRVERKQESVAGSVSSHTEELDQIQTRIEEQAVELYMRGGLASPGIIFSASTVDEFMTTSEFLTTAATGGQESLDELVAARGELNRFQAVLDDTRVELETVEAQKLDARTNQEAAMEAEQAAYAKLSGRCKELATEYDREQAELAARARQRAAGSVQVGSFICPFTPGRTSFIDSWGASRSGGRALTRGQTCSPHGTSRYTRLPRAASRLVAAGSVATRSGCWPTTGSPSTTPTCPISTSPPGRRSARARRSASTATAATPEVGHRIFTSRSTPVGAGRQPSIPMQRWQGHAGSLPLVSEHRRRIDTVLEPDYLADISEADLDELRRRRESAEDVEAQISYYRRLLHGRVDLLNFELRRRSGQEERSLIEALPEILAAGMTFGSEPNLRHLDPMPPIPATTGRRLIDRIMDDGILTQLPELTDDELTEAIERVQEVEAELSAQRRQLHGVIDALQDEIIARYRSQQGEAQPAG